MIFSRFIKNKKKATAPDGHVIYAIGDIHGRDDLLMELIGKIEGDLRINKKKNKASIIFLGDYVDRGMGSKAVIELLLVLKRYAGAVERDEGMHFLKGNHEEALLHFLDDPNFGEQWLTHGGKETLLSYGVQPPKSVTSQAAWQETAEALGSALGHKHLSFLRNLQPCIVRGDYIFVHAGLRPGKTIDKQSEKDMLWIREEFLSDTSRFEKKVVHGHTAKKQPYHDHRRIGIDTGAYITGVLTAVRLEADTVSFLQTGEASS